MLTAPRKIYSIIDANVMCLRYAVREKYRGRSERTNKQTHKLFAL